MLSRPSDTGHTPFGAALLDLEQPWKVLARTGPYLLHPETLYECTGDVPNVCFPCAALHDPQTGRVAVYYGAADTVVGGGSIRLNRRDFGVYKENIYLVVFIIN